MQTPESLGKAGEALSCTHLKSLGYIIVEKNWRFGRDEIDLIVENDDFIVFVEVKSRSTNYFGEPEVFVNRAKQRNLIRAANNYIRTKCCEKEARFDIVSVLMKGDKHQINHIPNAFYPTL